MLTAEVNEKLQTIELHVDEEGLNNLIERLRSLKQYDSHAHFMTPSWGGKELGEIAHGANKLMNHLIIYSHKS
jgi:hypothetical protein